MVSHLDATQLKRLQRQLLKKGGELNEKLTQLLGGAAVDVQRLPGLGKVGERPEERLRRFLDLVDRKLRQSRSQSGLYGRCESCGRPLAYVELEQMPWADLCRPCADKQAEEQ